MWLFSLSNSESIFTELSYNKIILSSNMLEINSKEGKYTDIDWQQWNTFR